MKVRENKAELQQAPEIIIIIIIITLINCLLCVIARMFVLINICVLGMS